VFSDFLLLLLKALCSNIILKDLEKTKVVLRFEITNKILNIAKSPGISRTPSNGIDQYLIFHWT
jgi:hypothetical protein